LLPRSAKLSRQPAGSGPQSRKSLKRATPASKRAVSGPVRRGAGGTPLPTGSGGERGRGGGLRRSSGGRWEVERVRTDTAIADGRGGVVCGAADLEARGSPRTPAVCPRRACRRARSGGSLAGAPAVPHLGAAGDTQARGAVSRSGWGHGCTFLGVDAARLAKQTQRCLRRAHRHEPFEEGKELRRAVPPQDRADCFVNIFCVAEPAS
jgi:hypothetical protein